MQTLIKKLEVATLILEKLDFRTMNIVMTKEDIT